MAFDWNHTEDCARAFSGATDYERGFAHACAVHGHASVPHGMQRGFTDGKLYLCGAKVSPPRSLHLLTAHINGVRSGRVRAQRAQF